MKQAKSEDGRVKCTVRLPEEVWHAARVQALSERRDFQELVADALRDYLKRKTKGKA